MEDRSALARGYGRPVPEGAVRGLDGARDSAGPPSATSAITSPVAGSDTVKVPPEAASIHSPSTNIR
jgi:hypothetical protein